MFLICFLMMMSVQPPLVIFDFNQYADLSEWYVVDDVVMGGESDGNMVLLDDGTAHFYGTVSLENNGGFSSIRYRFEPEDVEAYSTIVLKVKGNNQRFQCRVKSSERDWHSYIQYFEAPDEWTEIKLPLADFYPSFRGRKLDMRNYPKEFMTEVSILIANYKNESFDLFIDSIYLE